MQYQEQENIGVFTNLIYLHGNQLVGLETQHEQQGLSNTGEQSYCTLSVGGSLGLRVER
jgi:hypothetical protein